MTPKPTGIPVAAPTTSVPSAAPSMTGLVASFAVTKEVTSSLSESELTTLVEELKAEFNTDDVSTEGELLLFCKKVRVSFVFYDRFYGNYSSRGCDGRRNPQFD